MATRGLNRIHLIGYLGADPDGRYTPAGTALTTFSLAVGRVTGSGEGRRDETEWFRIVAWERLAETCNEYLHKGDRVFIEGRLQTRKYTDREGTERSIVEVVISDLVMLGTRPAAGTEAASAPEEPAGPVPEDEDPPF